MKNPFDWHHSLLYADKSREEYTMEKEGTLDHLLYQMYMVAHDCDGLFMSNSVKALNTAYYLAVGLYNIQHVEEENQMNGLVAKKRRKFWEKSMKEILVEFLTLICSWYLGWPWLFSNCSIKSLLVWMFSSISFSGKSVGMTMILLMMMGKYGISVVSYWSFQKCWNK